MIPVNWKLKLPPEHFALLVPVNPKPEKKVTVLAGVIDSDDHGKIGITTQQG